MHLWEYYDPYKLVNKDLYAIVHGALLDASAPAS